MQLVIAGKCSAGTLAGQRDEFRQKGIRGPLRRGHPQRGIVARVVRHEADIPSDLRIARGTRIALPVAMLIQTTTASPSA